MKASGKLLSLMLVLTLAICLLPIGARPVEAKDSKDELGGSMNIDKLKVERDGSVSFTLSYGSDESQTGAQDGYIIYVKPFDGDSYQKIKTVKCKGQKTPYTVRISSLSEGVYVFNAKAYKKTDNDTVYSRYISNSGNRMAVVVPGVANTRSKAEDILKKIGSKPLSEKGKVFEYEYTSGYTLDDTEGSVSGMNSHFYEFSSNACIDEYLTAYGPTESFEKADYTTLDIEEGILYTKVKKNSKFKTWSWNAASSKWESLGKYKKLSKAADKWIRQIFLGYIDSKSLASMLEGQVVWIDDEDSKTWTIKIATSMSQDPRFSYIENRPKIEDPTEGQQESLLFGEIEIEVRKSDFRVLSMTSLLAENLCGYPIPLTYSEKTIVKMTSERDGSLKSPEGF